jgi:aspartyl-tRNA synthetase
MQANKGDLLLILSGERSKVLKQLGILRKEVALKEKMIDENKFECLWVIDFPLFEYDEEEKRWVSMHHPFTSPKIDNLKDLDTGDLSSIKAKAYDMVINGVEVGGGSIRIHNKELQRKIFSILGLTDQEADEKFGFLMNAFQYGAPPHGGIAFGFDRLCAVISGEDSIRDFIAFPKNNSGRDVMIDAPSAVSPQQLKELHLKIDA